MVLAFAFNRKPHAYRQGLAGGPVVCGAEAAGLLQILRPFPSALLGEGDEAAIVAFRRHTLLPLDHCLDALQSAIPHLTRSALYRCLQRHGISRLPEVEDDNPPRQKFKRHPIGFFHIN
jgi:hypothetical protein